MKKEVGTYFSVGILILLGLFTVWIFNVGLTGYAVFQETTQSDFDLGTYSNTLYSNNALTLSENQTSGTYTSKIFDTGSSSHWANITTQGTTPEGTSLAFEVRVCSSADCSDSTFASASDLNNLNLTGRYLQYRITFTGISSLDNNTNITTYTSPTLTSISRGYSEVVVVTSATISQPSGTKTSATGIPITYTTTGSNLTCWYNVQNSSDGFVVPNTTLSGCSNSVFNISTGNGNYVLNLYVNGTSGFTHKDTGFTLTVSTEEEQPQEEQPQEEQEVLELPVVPPVVPETAPVITTTALSSNDIQPLVGLNPGKTQGVKWTIINSGNTPLSSCKISPTGPFASWVTADDMSVNLNAGESKEFNLNVNVPTTATDSTNTITMTGTCFETTTSKDFTVNVITKKLLLDVISTDRTRANRVRVVYTIEELLGINQNVTLKFSLFDTSNVLVSNLTQNKTIGANLTNDFTANLPINKSLPVNTTLNLQIIYNSEVYSDTVNKPLTLSAPLSGLAVIGEGLGTGGIVVVGIALAVLIIGFFVVRAMRKNSK